MKKEALSRMQKMGMASSAITMFKEQNHIPVVDPKTKEIRKATKAELKEIRAFEAKSGTLVYLVIRSSTLGYDVVSYVFVGKDAAKWEEAYKDIDENIVFTFTTCYTSPAFAEYGYICYEMHNGIPLRSC